MNPTVRVNRLNESAKIPYREYINDSGADLYSTEDVIIPSFEGRLISTSIKMNIPEPTIVFDSNGDEIELVWEIQIRSKSGKASKRNLFVLNSPGTIDSGYLDEVKVNLFNLSEDDQPIYVGEKIAQAVLSPVVCCDYYETGLSVPQVNPKNERGKNGFGSTGF